MAVVDEQRRRTIRDARQDRLNYPIMPPGQHHQNHGERVSKHCGDGSQGSSSQLLL